MNDGEALRRAVLAEPDEDTPRLVYADWLDENGRGDRATFIRAQIEAARADPGGLQERSARLRAESLLERHREAWTRHIRGAIRADFERGFIGRLHVEPPTLDPPAAAELFASEPIQSLRVTRPTTPDASAALEQFFEIPQLRQVRCLEIPPLTLLAIQEYAALSECKHLAGLRHLSLQQNPVPPAWLAKLLTGETFPELQGLDLGDVTHLGPGLVTAFAGAGHRGIRRLDVSRVNFTSEQLQRLLQSRCLRRVEELRLGCKVRRGDVGPLFHLDLGWVVPWERLRVLDLAGQGLGSEGVKEIARNAKAESLRSLGLAYNNLDSGAVRYLVGASHLRLSRLDLRGNGLSPSDATALRARFPDALIEV